jgi:epsilon-lactone hydrolase
MSSLQSYLYRFRMRLHRMRQRENGDLTYAQIRAQQDALATHYTLPSNIAYTQVQIADLRAAWANVIGTTSEQVILYWHGGAYVMGSMLSYRPQQARVARFTGARILLVDYRLAPEHPFPAAIEDACTSYRWLLEHNTKPEQIILMGDSAGGGLSVALILALRTEGLPLPAAVVCLSPWFDLACTGDSLRTRAKADLFLTPQELQQAATAYLGTTDPYTPLASPLYADLRGLPPLFLQIGTNDILLDDSLRLAERARKAGVQVELEVWQHMPHVWQMAGRLLPEARQAMQHIQHFVHRYTPTHV